MEGVDSESWNIHHRPPSITSNFDVGPWPWPRSKFTLKVVSNLISQAYQVLIDQDVLACRCCGVVCPILLRKIYLVTLIHLPKFSRLGSLESRCQWQAYKHYIGEKKERINIWNQWSKPTTLRIIKLRNTWKEQKTKSSERKESKLMKTFSED